eukprot:TRINITY_DN20709_c1_g1_i2.p1 TRINITY_DN20709_c1_g1~~TRINITY_DN20709_c1_g1_i2.p1  ORF type:complete len:828 (-),score=179.38 TRINITY_DN20709_c1_g1_i2:317-2800(-)
MVAAWGDGPSGPDDERRRADQQALIRLLAERGDGSWLRGWRRVLDPDGMQQVDFQDYIHAAAKLSFHGDAVLLFGGDGDSSALDVGEVSAPEGLALERFMRWSQERFGGPMAMFSGLCSGTDDAAEGKLSRDAFFTACQERGAEVTDEELAFVYDFCDFRDAGFLTRGDVICLEEDPEVRAEEVHQNKTGELMRWRRRAAEEYLAFIKGYESLTAWSHDSSPHAARHKSRLEPRIWHASSFENMPFVMSCVRKERALASLVRYRRAREFFFEHLQKVHGHPVRALRRELDNARSFSFPKQVLRTYCRRHDLSVDVVDLWAALDVDKDGLVRMEDLDVHTSMALARFKVWAQQMKTLGSTTAIWSSPEMEEVSRQSTGTWFADKKAKSSVFACVLRALGWPGMNCEDTRNRVLRALDLHGCGVIGLPDLQWLDHWRPVEWLVSEPDPDAWIALKSRLLQIFGHPLRAWRCLLDRDDSNHLSWDEFRDACRRIKFESAGSAWRSLDVDLTGAVSLKAYDKESFDLLNSFKDWVEVNFGSIKQCFKVLDQDRSNSVSYNELRRACQRLRWKGDLRLLFDCIDTDKLKEGGSLEAQRAISLSEIAFLDNWQAFVEEEPPPEPPKRRSSVLGPRMSLAMRRLSEGESAFPDAQQLLQLQQFYEQQNSQSSEKTETQPARSKYWSRATSIAKMQTWNERPLESRLLQRLVPPEDLAARGPGSSVTLRRPRSQGSMTGGEDGNGRGLWDVSSPKRPWSLTSPTGGGSPGALTLGDVLRRPCSQSSMRSQISPTGSATGTEASGGRRRPRALSSLSSPARRSLRAEFSLPAVRAT